MAKKNSKSAWRRIFSNRRLISVESILLVGLFENYVESQVNMLDVAVWVQTLLIMLLIAGIFGGLVTVITAITKRSLIGGHNALQSLPIPTPMLLIHGVAFFGLYWLYANYWF